MDKIIAVDFDDTLFIDRYPAIGEPIYANIKLVKEEQQKGTKIILWTTRTGAELKTAIESCNSVGIYPDAVNDNVAQVIDAWGCSPRKIFANEYWDDRAVTATSTGINTWHDLVKNPDDIPNSKVEVLVEYANGAHSCVRGDTIVWEAHKVAGAIAWKYITNYINHLDDITEEVGRK